MVTKEEKKAVYDKKWRAENPEKRKAAVMKWREANSERFAAIAKANHVKQVENLTDYYVSKQLARLKGIHQTPRQLRQYPEIIDCYRAILKVRRMCRIKIKENGNK